MSQNNPYLDLVNDNQNNEYVELAKQDNNELQSEISGATFVAKNRNPDEFAERVTLAQKFGVRSDFVDQNYDTIKGKISEQELADKLNQSSEKLKEFATDPDNLSVSKDDLDTLGKIEESANKHSFSTQSYNAFMAGLAKLNSSIAKTPAYVGNITLIPSNIVRSLMNKPQVAYEIENPVSEYYDNSVEYFTQKAPKTQESITNKIKQGKYAEAGEVAALQVIQNAPQQIALIGAALSGVGTAGLIGAGLTTAADKASELQDQGVEPLQVTGVAAAHGTIEAAFESIGTLGVLKSWESAIAKDFGKQTSKEFLFNFGKTLSYSMMSEGNEEAATSFAQDFTDYVTGVNPNAMKGSVMRALDAGIIGGLSGGAMTAPTGISAGIAKQGQIKQAKINQEFYLSIGDASNESKLKQRLPEKYREYVEHVTKDGPIENVFIDVEGFKSYFQKKDINPALIAQELGISKEFDEASEAGHDIKIPTHVMAEKLAGSEHYQGLADHVKFNPEDLTVAQAKAVDEADKNMLAEQYEEAKKDKTDDEVKTVEESAREVGNNVKQQLKDNGYSHKAASHQAKLYEEFFKVQGMKSNQMPMDLFNKYGLKIQSIEQAPQDNTKADMLKLLTEMANIQGPNTTMQPATRDDSGKLVLDINNLDVLRDRIAKAEAGYRSAKVDDNGEVIGSVGVESTFPEFFKNKGYTKKDTLAAIDKYKSGKELTAKQDALLEDLYNGMADSVNRNEYFQKSDYRGQHTSWDNKINELGFYSKLEDTIASKMANAASPKDIMGLIKEIKPEEIKWSGIEEFLKGKDKVKKEEVIAFLKANQLQIKEVTKGGEQPQITINDFDSSYDVQDKDIEGLEAEHNFIVPDALNDVIEYATIEEFSDGNYELNINGNGRGSFDRMEKAIIAIEEFISGETGARFSDNVGQTDSTKYSQYTLPGGENYREVLMTLPVEPVKNDMPNFEVWTERKGIPTFEARADWESEGPLKKEYVKELNKSITGKPIYKSDHWDEKNILAHTRLNDRVDADGQKVLFIEEIQSDWHQEGRKKGYRGEPIVKAQAEFESFRKQMTEKYGPAYFSKLTDEERSQYDKLVEPAAEEQADRRVPDAPFRKTWHEFTFKRIVRMAAEQGYDRVAWTTGEQQAERFDLSKSIREIDYVKRGENEYGIYVIDKGGNQVFDKSSVTEDELENTVGKDLAKKIVETATDKSQKLKGLDLKVGGEGMKGFYDKILVDFANKFGKKFGAKVGETEISTPSQGTSEDAKLLQDLGVEGTAKQSTKVHSLDITPELKNAALNEGFTLFQQEKGSITFGKDRQFNINLFKAKDESTFLHETGHFFLEVMADLAQSDKATDQLKKDYQTILEWFDVKSKEEIKTEHHEKFARGFESYLMNGKAPSDSLRKAFHNFRQWLISIYQKATNLNVEVSPEITSVFDRMLASDEEINKLDIQPLFSDPSGIGMTEEEQYEYLNAIEWARLDARDRLQAKLMQDLIRKKDTAYKNKYDEIYKDEKLKAENMVEFKTIDAIQGDLKLSKNLIEKHYSVFKNYLPYRSTILDGGQNPDVVASIFGYENGQAMLQAIAPYRRGIEDYVDSQVATKMKELYPELLESPELSNEAIEAAHNDNLKKVKKMELEYLYKTDSKVYKNIAEKLIKRLPKDAMVKKQAIQMIAGTSVKDLKPHLYRSAERRYATEAAKAFKKGDFDKAFEAKRKEYLNFELFNIATKAKQDVDKSVKNFKKLFKSDEDLSKGRDIDLVNAARAILAEFGITRADKTADEYLSKMKAYDPEAYAVVSGLVAEALKNKGNYYDVSYENFVEMRDTVDAIFDLSKSRKEIEIDGKRVNIDQVINDLVSQMKKYTPINLSDMQETVNEFGKLKEKLLGAKASLVRAEAWSRAMDTDGSTVFQSSIFRPVSDAVANYRIKKGEVLKKYETMLREYGSGLSQEAIKSDELKFIFKNKAELIMAILHSGNESNLTKLLVGRGWGSFDNTTGLDRSKWDAFIGRLQKEGILKKEDFDFAQNIWDLMESLKPDAQKAHKQLFGYYFNEITAKSFDTEYGKYRGGYIPAKTDPYTVEDSAIRREREEFENNNNSFQFPTTGRGFTKSRVDSYNMPLSLDINMLGSHIDSVLRFTYIEPRVKEVAKIVTDKGFRSELSKIDTNIAKDMLVPWLQRSAQQKVQLPSQDGLGKVTDAIARVLRKNVATQIMFAGVTNTLQQFTGLNVAMTLVKPKYIRNALWSYTTNNKQVVESIMDKSKWMQSTQGSNIHDIHSSINEIIMNPSTFEKVQEFSRKHTYFLQSAAQNMVNTIVWSGAYEQAIESGKKEIEAIKEADSVVRSTQGTNNPEDISRYETGTATELLFKQFVGYFNMIANLNASELVKISREVGLRKGAGRAFYVYLMAFMLPAVLSDIIVRAMGGKFDQDDDDNYVDDMMTSFFGSQFKTAMAAIPYGGQLAVAAYNKVFTKNVADDRLSLSPAISILETTVAAPYDVYKTIQEGGDIKKKTVKDALQFVGIMTGIPTGPVGKPVGYLMDVDSGKADPSGPVDFTRGLITGKSGN